MYSISKSSEELDFILRDGTDLYTYIHNHCGSGGYLYHRDLPNNFQNWNRDYGEVEYFYDRYYGPVHNMQLIGVQANAYHLSILLHFVIVL